MKKISTLTIILAYILICTLSVNAQWQTNGPFNPPTGYNVQSLAASGTDIFAGSNINGIFLSTDSGANWTQMNTGLTDTNMLSLCTFGGGKYVFAGTVNGLFMSTDTGKHWTAKNNGLTSITINALAVSGTNIFAATAINGLDGGVFLSSDTGANWTSVNTDLIGINGLSFAVSGTYVFLGTGNGVYYSTDFGDTWTNISNGMTSLVTHSLAVKGTTLYTGTDDGVFLSTDTGANWMTYSNSVTGYSINSLLVSGSSLFAGTLNDGVYISWDDGFTWTSVNDGLTTSWVNSLLINGTRIFAATSLNGTDGGVWQRPLTDVITNVVTHGPKARVDIYPNPAADKITIRYSNFNISKHANVSVVDFLGRTVYQSEIKNPQSEISLSFLPAGIYFLQMKSESGSVVKRFVKE